MGPRAHSILSKLDRRFSDVMFYGWFGFISKPMLWMLVKLEGLMSFTVASWGLAVILLTLLVRGGMWPLTLKSTRQMKRMSLLAPQMKELQLKYKDDPQKMNAQVMGLYKKYGRQSGQRLPPDAPADPDFLRPLHDVPIRRRTAWAWVLVGH